MSAEQREKQQVHVLCRLKPDATLETAQADLERVARQFGHNLPSRSLYNGSGGNSSPPLKPVAAGFVV